MSSPEEELPDPEQAEAQAPSLTRSSRWVPYRRRRFDGAVLNAWAPVGEIDQEQDEARWDEHADKAAAQIGADLLSMEARLLPLKWFDYRYMHPVQATIEFARCYRRLYGELFGKYFDMGQRELKMGIARQDIFAGPAKTLTGLWRARQFVDARMMRYDFYIRRYMEHWLERGAKQLPRPNQLWKEEIAIKVEKDWRENCGGSLEFSVAPQYWNENYIGDPAQDAHRDWLIQQVNRRVSKQFPISRLVFSEGVLDEARAVAEFGASVVAEAKGYALPPAEPHNPLRRVHHWPACYGGSHAHLGAEEPCGSCRWSERCASKGRRLRHDIVAVLGVEDPAVKRRREADRERQRRHRAKKAAKL